MSGFATIRGDAWKLSDPDLPLTLVCSPALQVVPWELMLDSSILVRAFSLLDVLVTRIGRAPESPIKKESADAPVAPTPAPANNEGDNRSRLEQELWLASYPQSRALIEGEVVAHKMVLKKMIWYRLRTVRRSELPRLPPAMWPLPSALSHTSTSLMRHELVHMFECSGEAIRVLSLVDGVQEGRRLFVFGYSDLLEMSDALAVLRSRKPPMLFVPDAHIKHVVRTITKLHAAFMKRAKSERDLRRFDFLVDLMRTLQLDERLPVAFFNPTWNR